MDDLWKGLLNDVPENKRSDTLDRSVSKERRYDMEGIKNAGYDLTTPVIVTNSDDWSDVRAEKTGNTMVLEKIITVE